MGLSDPFRGGRRVLPVSLVAISVLLGAPLVALATWPRSPTWPQFQGGATHAGMSDGPAAPLAVAWTNADIPLGGPDARGGLSAPVVAGDGTIVSVAPTAVLGFSPTDGSSVFEADRDFGPSAQPAVAEGADGAIVVFTEGYGDRPPAATASPTGAPSPSPTDAGDGDGFDSHVDAVDLAGERVWEAPAQLDALVLMPVAVDGRAAYVGDVDGVVTALELRSGEERWTADVGSSVAGAIALDGDRVYVASLGSQTLRGAVVALDVSTGEELWRTTEDAISGNVVSAPVVTDGAILVLEAGSVVSLDPEDGALNWSANIVNPRVAQPFAPQGVVAQAAVPAGRLVIAVDITGRVYALDAETGAMRWDHALNDPSAASPPVVTPRQVLVPTNSGALDAIDLRTGHLVSRLDVDERGLLRGLADAGEMLVAVAGSDDAALIAFEDDPDGTLVDEPSPTTFDLGRFLGGFVIGGLLVGAVVVGLLRPLQRRLGPAIEVPSEDATPGDG